MEADLRALLAASPGVAALAQTRVGWGVRPQGGALPAVTLMTVSTVRGYTMRGADDLTTTRVQADCFDATLTGAKALAAAVVAAASGFAGLVGGTRFLAVFVDGPRDFYDAGETETAALYRCTLDLIIHHRSA